MTREHGLRRRLLRFELLSVDPATDFEAAARIYRRCRRQGVTQCGLIDCMVAAVARRTGSQLLAHDVDLQRVAGVVGITMDESPGHT